MATATVIVVHVQANVLAPLFNQSACDAQPRKSLCEMAGYSQLL